MTQLRIPQAASLLGVSDDTMRRWCDSGKVEATTDSNGRKVVAGVELARVAQEVARGGGHDDPAPSSARNRFTGLVTDVRRDTVMAQVELQCGPFRVVSLMSREAADELELQPGSLATATVKSTNVIVEVPA
ncbi:TOBE domain-containing protein [Demetria terragena]|uniref:TOBE domain-containing protein n=1 Tax=Demetria terragena TaxID=63959 RepID=UPI00039F9A4A|nr:TOBE domain-containing protein [Demetria terragena]